MISEKTFPVNIRVWAHDVKDAPMIMVSMFAAKLGCRPEYKTADGRAQCRSVLQQVLDERHTESGEALFSLLESIDKGPFFPEVRPEMLEAYRFTFDNYMRWTARSRSYMANSDVCGAVADDRESRLVALAYAIFDDVFRLPITFESLWEIISMDLRRVLENSRGLSFFASNRAKFEGWLKVELCSCLSRFSSNVVPEKGLIDVVVDDWAIELKTINTNYRCAGVVNKGRPITKNVASVVSDIHQLRVSEMTLNKAVAFVVFPLPDPAPKWPYLLTRITDELAAHFETDFHFDNGVRGQIYLGLVGPAVHACGESSHRTSEVRTRELSASDPELAAVESEG